MSNQLTIEWTPFEILPDTTETQLVEAAKKVETDFLANAEGFVRRELLKKDEKNWVDLVYWRSPEAAKAVMQDVYQSEVCMAYFSLMEPMEKPEEVIMHYQQILA